MSTWSVLKLLFLVGAASIGLVTGSAWAVPPDPPRDLLLGAFPASCYERPGTPGPTSPECENAAVFYLDRARGEMGLPPYNLPANFTALSPDRQMFILANLDRTAYSLPPVPGLNAELDTVAEEGMKAERDPTPAQQSPWAPFYGADWAAFPNALWGYYIWMYSDESVGWGHRHVVFYEGFATLGMGASAGVSSNDRESSALIIQSASEPPPFYYTWTEALATGAGSNVYEPSVPQFTVMVTFAGSGAGAITGSFTCQATCTQSVTLGAKVSLSAVPAAGASFAGWGGACSGPGTCELTGDTNEMVTATFTRVPTSSGVRLGTIPIVKLLHVALSSRTRKARFTFTAVGGPARFQCALTRRAAKRHKPAPEIFTTCTSPRIYRNLGRGVYLFAVRATTQNGLTSHPIERRFLMR